MGATHMTVAVPGSERCDYCGGLLKDGSRGRYEYFYQYGRVTVRHHIECEEVFQGRMRNAQEHLLMCHLDGCERMPVPTRWVDRYLSEELVEDELVEDPQ